MNIIDREFAKPFKAQRDAIINADIDVPTPKERVRLTAESVDRYLQYYEDVLEGLGGTQIWQILDAYEHLCEIKREAGQQ